MPSVASIPRSNSYPILGRPVRSAQSTALESLDLASPSDVIKRYLRSESAPVISDYGRLPVEVRKNIDEHVAESERQQRRGQMLHFVSNAQANMRDRGPILRSLPHLNADLMWVMCRIAKFSDSTQRHHAFSKYMRLVDEYSERHEEFFKTLMAHFDQGLNPIALPHIMNVSSLRTHGMLRAADEDNAVALIKNEDDTDRNGAYFQLLLVTARNQNNVRLFGKLLTRAEAHPTAYFRHAAIGSMLRTFPRGASMYAGRIMQLALHDHMNARLRDIAIRQAILQRNEVFATALDPLEIISFDGSLTAHFTHDDEKARVIEVLFERVARLSNGTRNLGITALRPVLQSIGTEQSKMSLLRALCEQPAMLESIDDVTACISLATVLHHAADRRHHLNNTLRAVPHVPYPEFCEEVRDAYCNL